MTARVELTGLEGTNPLGFLAALGVLSLPDGGGDRGSRLAWTDDMVPYAVVSGFSSVDEVAERAMSERQLWRDSMALTFSRDGEQIDDVKLSGSDLRHYIEACLYTDDGGRSIALASALVAEGSYDRLAKAKPTDLHFTAGQQKFLRMARELLDKLDEAALAEALAGPWTYESELPSFMWDVTDDRVYALASYKPSSEKKQTEPGAEFLALLGLAALPVFAGKGGTQTTGCSGSWKAGALTWPIWAEPCSFRGACSLLLHASAGNQAWLAAWGVRRLMSSPIVRSEQGGSGTLSPPTEIWRAAF